MSLASIIDRLNILAYVSYVGPQSHIIDGKSLESGLRLPIGVFTANYVMAVNTANPLVLSTYCQ